MASLSARKGRRSVGIEGISGRSTAFFMKKSRKKTRNIVFNALLSPYSRIFKKKAKKCCIGRKICVIIF